ncbi:DNA repair protein RecO [Parapedobacter sp. ISTM3]|uniref:DNA repair protein RecO n=1 Tax=Parapedobacter luteus TaxID=623280 RepID=A0A1T5CWW1_9SPHI|nr:MULTISPECIES: DNA repair protein RecO [Parapedobacter]MBK1440664.1 DNA repair protein RecO [Parapedobacter sp. ISTM3]SKB63816.1 DNA replication and repair protein RecO [Parapedobacter luteus]
MLHKTRGIVLKTTNYSESSVVAQVFTEKFGLQSYLVNGARKPKAKISITLLQPLHLLEMVVYHRENTSLQRISEARQMPHFQTIPYDIVKSTVVLFLNEMLYKSLRQQSPDEPLFGYLFNAISWLDTLEKMPPNFHLLFLIKLSRFLGFNPAPPKAGQTYFDLKDGIFCDTLPAHRLVLQHPHTAQFAALLNCSFEKLSALRIPLADRRFLLDKIIDFYRLHVDHMGDIKSREVLEEVLG